MKHIFDLETVMALAVRRIMSAAKAREAWVMTVAVMISGAVLAPSLAQAAAETSAPIAIYRLQPGDEVAISILPQKSYDCGGVLLPDGLLTLKNIGPIKAAGLSLTELAEKVRSLLSDRLIGHRVAVTITGLHTEEEAQPGSITVAGVVAKPGMQLLGKGLRLRRALDLAGVSLTKADLKRVRIRHKDLTRAELDVSTPERITDPTQNLLLQDGDAIEVTALTMRAVSILGAVSKPGTFELTDGLRLQGALELAGGSLGAADVSRVAVRHRDLTRTEVDLSTAPLIADLTNNLLLADGDAIEVPLRSAPDAQVRIRGEVLNPGRFNFQPNMTLEDLIAAAGKATSLANTEGIQLQRRGEPVQIINLFQQKRLGLQGDVRLMEGDEVFVPEVKDAVLLLGAVPRPGKMALKPGQSLVEFFTQGNEEAALLDPGRVDMRDVRVIRDGKESVKVNVSSLLTKPGGRNKDVALRPGDIIYLPPMILKGQKKTPLDYVSYVNQVGVFTK